MKPPFVKSYTPLPQLDIFDGPGDGSRADRNSYKSLVTQGSLHPI
jgi:hypothetical protein